MNLFDLHCDTALELYLQNQPLKDGSLHVSLDKARMYDTYIQTMACWSDKSLSDNDAYTQFLLVTDRLRDELAENHIPLIRDKSDLADVRHKQRRGVILAVEDARLLAGDLSRIQSLHDRGVRFMTLLWSGETCIGGAHDTGAPLTDFGRTVVETCFHCGIVPDLSHASRRVTEEVLTMAKAAHKPAVATHSNAFAVHAHTRNLTDSEFRAVAACGGIVGISLYPPHLTDGACAISDVIRHVKHFLSVGGEDTLALGCDFDGIEITPDSLSNLSCMGLLYEELCRSGISERVADKIFFENAYGFTAANI